MEKQKLNKVIGTYQSADHRSNITCFQYIPQGVDKEHPPKAVVQVIHGMCEYVERYEHFAEFLAEQNIVMCGEDHLGHGRTAASEYELGYFGEKGGHMLLAKDAYRLTEKMKAQYPGVPYFYFGHSMGSFVLRDLLSRFKPSVTGAIICGTAGGGQPFGVAKLLIMLIRAVRGSRYRSKFINQLMFGSYNRRIENPTSVHAWVSSDEKLVEVYDADPKCNFIFTIAAMEDLVSLLARVSEKNWAGLVPKEIPLYLVAGEQDPVGDYGKGVTQVYERLKAAGVQDVSLQLYPNDRHELLNELDKDSVMNDLLVWMQAHGI